MAVLAVVLLLTTHMGPLFPGTAQAASPQPPQREHQKRPEAALDRFAQLLAETGVQVHLPAAYHPVPLPAMVDLPWAFDRAWRHAQGLVEVRMMVRPLARMQIDYDDPHSAAPHPDHVYPLVFQSLVNQLSAAGSTTPSRIFPSEEARKRFNADWAAMAAFAPDPAVNTKHHEAMLLAVHRKRQGDVFVLFLFSEPRRAKQELHRLLSILRFTDRAQETQPGPGQDG